MKNFKLLIMLLMLAFTACNQAKKADPVPLEDFFKNPEKTAFQLSPSGDYFSYLAPFENRLNVFVQAVNGSDSIRITSETDRDIAGYIWASNKRLLYLKDTGGDENYQLYGVNLDGSEFKALTAFEGVRTQIIDELEDLPTEIIVGLNKRDARVFDPYRLNIETGELIMLAENPGNIVGWMTDHDGKLRVAIASDGVNQTYLYRNTEADDFQPVISLNFKETLDPLMFTFDNKLVYAKSNLGRDKEALVIYDLANAKEIEVIFETKEADVSGINYSKKDKKLLAVNYYTDKRQLHFLDDETRILFEKISALLPGVEVSFANMNKAEDKIMIRTYSDKTRGAYSLYDKASDELTPLAELF